MDLNPAANIRRAALLRTPPAAVPSPVRWETVRVRIPRKHSRIGTLNWSAAFTPLPGSKALRHWMLKRRKRRAPDVRFMGRVSFN